MRSILLFCINLFLVTTCAVTIISVVAVGQENRELNIELQQVYDERDAHNIEYERVLIELAAMSRFDKVEDWSRTNDNNMRTPENHAVISLNTPTMTPVSLEVAR